MSPTPSTARLLALLCLLAPACSWALPTSGSVSDAAPDSAVVQQLRAEPVEASLSNLQHLLEVQQAFVQIHDATEADALARFLSRKLMMDLIGESLDFTNIHTAGDAITAERTRLEQRDPLESLRRRVAQAVSIEIPESLGNEFTGENATYLGHSLWSQVYSAEPARIYYHLRVRTHLALRIPVDDFHFAAHVAAEGGEALQFNCRPNPQFKPIVMPPYAPGGVIDTACTLGYPVERERMIQAAAALATGSTTLVLSVIDIDRTNPWFSYGSDRQREPAYIFGGELRTAAQSAWQRLRHASCRDLGTCGKDARELHLGSGLLWTLVIGAGIVVAVRAVSRSGWRRRPVLFGFVAALFLLAVIIARQAESVHGSMAGMLFVMPALALSMPWSLMDIPVIGLRHDVDTAQLALFGGMALNLAIIAALTLWRSPSAAEANDEEFEPPP